nr:hypothetical protein [uncultured Methanobrevibacter sp.]
MKREIHEIYDYIMKIIILAYLSEFLKYIGYDGEIDEVLQTEVFTVNGSKKNLDFLCRLKDGTICHIEFQFPVAYGDDLGRFFNYNIIAEIQLGSTVNSIIFNFTESGRGLGKIKIGNSKNFCPRIFYLGDIDFEYELEIIHIKLGLRLLENIIKDEEKNIRLTYQEELHLLLMSLAPKYDDKSKLLKSVVGLLKNKNIFHEEKINIIQSLIQIEIDNFLNEDERKEFEGDIEMTSETEEIMMRAAREVRRKSEQQAIEDAEKRGWDEGREEGREEGRDEGKKEVAKNLKGLFSPEEISKITGLNLSTILLL